MAIRSGPAPVRAPQGRTAATPTPAPTTAPTAAPSPAKPASASASASSPAPLFRDGWERALRDKKPGLFSVDEGAVAAVVRRWAAHYPARTVVPVAGDRGTVGGFDDAQLKILHTLFWSAPPGAELDDIAALAKKEPAFKGRGALLTDDALKNVTRYRPDSFPFSWAERKRAVCSLVVVEALTTTPADVAAMTVLGQLRQTFAGFLSEPVIGRLARDAWVTSPEVFPFVAGRLERNGGKGYTLACSGEVKGLPRFGGKLKISAELAAVVSGLKDDPRVRYDHEFDDVLKMLSADLGEPFGDGQWRKLREQFKDVPDWFAVHGAARRRFAVLVKELHETRGLGPAELVDVLHEEHGYPRYEPARFALLRKEFPDLIPAFRQTKVDSLLADAAQLQAAVKNDPTKPYDDVGAALGFDQNRVKALLRVLRLQDPTALPLRKAPNKPWSDGERKQLRDAVNGVAVGAPLPELWQALAERHPRFFVERPLVDPRALGAALRRELGVDWRALSQQRFERLVAETLQGADAGVSLRELSDHLRDEHDCRFGYGALKQLLRDVEKNPQEHPALARLGKSGRYPWQLGGALTRELATTVAAAMQKHPEKTLAGLVALLKKDAALAKTWPTFGKGHIHKLRVQFPDVVPYVDELRSPQAQKETKAFAGSLDALAKKAATAAAKMSSSSSGPSIAALSQALGVDAGQLRQAIVRHPEDFPWYRRRPTGNIDLALAFSVAHAMEEAPFGTTLDALVDGLKKNEAFRARYPSFSKATISTLREAYADVVPGWAERDMLLRTTLIAEALRAAPKGTPYADVVAQLEQKHPGAFSGSYKNESYMRWFWGQTPERFPMLDALRDKSGALVLAGHGEKPHSSSSNSSNASASQTATRAARLSRIPQSLPLIDFLVEKCKDAPLDSGGRYEFVCVQHLLDSQLPVYDALKKMGMSPSRTTLIGVPYSASDLVVQALDDKGWDVRVPPLDMDVWEEEVREVLHERLESALETNRSIAILDDGGICAKLVATDPLLRAHATRFKIVEQTRRGITVADQVDLATPVVNVAQSQGKFAEGPLIAKDVEQKTVERLAKIGITSLKGKKVGVVGAGTIGLPIALHLKAQGAEVTILDPGEAAQKNAKKHGLAVADVDARAEFFADKDVVIGATGNAGITAADIARSKDGCVFGSASSKLVEIDVAALAEQSKGRDGRPQMKVIDGDSHPPSVAYTLHDGTTRRLLARGFPVNFDGAQENIDFAHIQLTRALMVLGLMQATGSKVPGVKRLDPALQLELLERFKALGALNTDEQQRVLDEAIAALQGAVAKPGSNYRRRG